MKRLANSVTFCDGVEFCGRAVVSEPRMQSKDEFWFGPFRLCVPERILEKHGVPVSLGGRALDILIVLAENAGKVVVKRDLLARVWAGVNVDEGSIRFHVAELRKALGDGVDGARYVTNVPGRGYCLVAPLATGGAGGAAATANVNSKTQSSGLPARLSRMVGRDEAVDSIITLLEDRRFVSIVGPGGIGKTTVAVAAGHLLRERFDGAVHFIDLAQLSDPQLVAVSLASTFGISVQSEDLLPSLLTFLRGHRTLMILDSSEHLIESVAGLMAALFPLAEDLHVLATSREPLQVEGEYVFRLYPLDTPQDSAGLLAAAALQYPAVQLFTERVAASQGRFELRDEQAPIVADICRKLDGIALAIELTASRVEAYGLEGTAALLDDSFRLLWRGRRTALPRHRTLGAVLDWSYNLLSEALQTLLRRLAIFAGGFSLEAAQEVAATAPLSREDVIEGLSDLVAKSLITLMEPRAPPRYRLLDTTRTYVGGKLRECGEFDQIAARHAGYCGLVLEAANAVSVELTNQSWLKRFGENLDNARAALAWSFSDSGIARLGAELAAQAAPMMLRMSLLTECHRWTALALETLVDTDRGTARELELMALLGQSLMFTKGGDVARDTLEHGLELAIALGSPHQTIRLLDSVRVFNVRKGDFQKSLDVASRTRRMTLESRDHVASANWMLANSSHLTGDQTAARGFCRAALSRMPVSVCTNVVDFGYDLRIAALCNLARILWLQGDMAGALKAAELGLGEAQASGHSFTLCIALIWVIPVFIWSGEWERAEEHIDVLLGQSRKYALGPYHAVGVGFRGELLLKRRPKEEGLALLYAALEPLRQKPYQNLVPVFMTVLAEGLLKSGDAEEAMVQITDALIFDAATGENFYTAEVLRAKGLILARLGDAQGAKASFSASADVARRQSALGWELRTAISLALFHLERNQPALAGQTLRPIYEKFPSGQLFIGLVEAQEVLREADSAS